MFVRADDVIFDDHYKALLKKLDVSLRACVKTYLEKSKGITPEEAERTAYQIMKNPQCGAFQSKNVIEEVASEAEYAFGLIIEAIEDAVWQRRRRGHC